MINQGQIKADELKIQGLIDSFLKFRQANKDSKSIDDHLDHDSLTAFIEGKISEKESPAIIEHLLDCSFCLHVTSELVKLSDAFAETEIVHPVNEPTKVSTVLDGLLSRIFGTTDGAVFAHQEDEKDDDDSKPTQ